MSTSESTVAPEVRVGSATHVLKIQESWTSRVRSGEKRAEIRKYDRDFQAGDTLVLTPADRHGIPIREFIARDERGRFVNEYRPVAPIRARITHVLPAAQFDGLVAGYCLLSIEVTR